MSVSTALNGSFSDDRAADVALVLDSIPDGVYGVDPSGRTVLVNRAAATMLGYQPHELIGTRPHDVLHHTRADGTPCPPSNCPMATATRDAHDCHHGTDVFWRRDGTSFPVEYDGRPLHRGDSLVGYVVTFRDITARRSADDRVRPLLRDQFASARTQFQHAQLRGVLAQAPGIMCVTRGPLHVIETVNEMYRELVGGDEVHGRFVRDVFPDPDHELISLMDLAYTSGVAQRGQARPLARAESTGQADRLFNVVFQPLRDESGVIYGLMTHAVDVTEEVQSRRTLERQNRVATLTADVGLALTRSTALPEILDACARSVVENLDAAFARIWTLNDTEQMLELQASAGKYTHLDGPHARVPVGRFKIGLIAQERLPHLTNDVPGDDRIGDRAWARREGMRAFAGYPLMVGDELVGVLAMFARHELSASALQALATVANGIALGIQRKRGEEALQARAQQLGQLAEALERTNAELDAFAYAASHDLRAPLRGVANLAQWIEEDLDAAGNLRPDTREMLELLRSRMHRMEALIEGILEYSRAGRVTQPSETLDMRQLVQDVVDLMAVPVGTSVLIGELPAVRSAPLPLQQIFINLVGNALKYAGRSDAVVHIDARDAGRFVEFRVSDNGPGIAPEYHERIWGMFQTLEARDKVEGTGIGLSLVKKLVEGQGGRAWVQSALGDGAIFRFLWPKQTREELGVA
ncbi:MAG TPA: ATP-binding protein [Vicinamibacterales bacterium]|nr:ATP-binding protein [Vicinamibacterales bacterium]